MTISYFYVLYCKDGTLYGGYTTDISRRLKEHNSGTGAKYTRPVKRRPATMLYAEGHQTRSEATKAEAAFKKLTRRQKEAFLKTNGVSFPLVKQKECVVNELVRGDEDHHADTKEL